MSLVQFAYDDLGINPTAIIGHQPALSPLFGRRTEHWSPPVIGKGVVVDAFAVIFCGAYIGDDSFIGLRSTIREECRIGKRNMIGADNFFNYDVQTGDDVRIIQGCHIGANCRIGSGTFIGPGVTMSNMRHIDVDHQVFNRQDAAPIIIGERCMIGTGASIVAGVTIGDRAVIAQGSVVTKDVPPGGFVKGNPAR